MIDPYSKKVRQQTLLDFLWANKPHTKIPSATHTDVLRDMVAGVLKADASKMADSSNRSSRRSTMPRASCPTQPTSRNDHDAESPVQKRDARTRRTTNSTNPEGPSLQDQECPPPKHQSEFSTSQSKSYSKTPARKSSRLPSETKAIAKPASSPSESYMTDEQESGLEEIAVNNSATSGTESQEYESDSDCRVTHTATRRPVESEHSRSSSKSQAQASTFGGGASSEPKRPRVSFAHESLHTSDHKTSKSSTSDTVSSRKIHTIPSNIPSNKSHRSSQVDNSNPIPSKSSSYSTLANSHESAEPFRSRLAERKYVTKPDQVPTGGAETARRPIRTTSEVLQNPLLQLSVNECQLLSKLLDGRMQSMLKNLGSSANSSSAKSKSSLLKAGSSLMEAEPFSLPIAKPKVAPKVYRVYEPIESNLEKPWYTMYCRLSQQNEQQMIHSLIPPSRGSVWLPLTEHAVTTPDLSLDPKPKPSRHWLRFVEPEEPPATLPKNVLANHNEPAQPIPAVPAESHSLPPSALDLLKRMSEIQHQAFLMMTASESCPQLYNGGSRGNGSIVPTQHASSGTRGPNAQGPLHHSPNQFGEMSFGSVNRPHTFSPAPAPSSLPTFSFSAPDTTNSRPGVNSHKESHPLGSLPISARPIASPRQFTTLSPTDNINSARPISDRKKFQEGLSFQSISRDLPNGSSVPSSSDRTGLQVTSALIGSTNSSKNVEATSDFNTKGPMTIGDNMLARKSPGISERDISQESGSDAYHCSAVSPDVGRHQPTKLKPSPSKSSDLPLSESMPCLASAVDEAAKVMKNDNNSPSETQSRDKGSQIKAHELALSESTSPITSVLDHLSPRGTNARESTVKIGNPPNTIDSASKMPHTALSDKKECPPATSLAEVNLQHLSDALNSFTVDKGKGCSADS